MLLINEVIERITKTEISNLNNREIQKQIEELRRNIEKYSKENIQLK